MAMALSVQGEPASLFEEDRRWRGCSFGPACSWALGTALTVLVIINSVTVRSVDKLRLDYLDKLEALDTRMASLEPVYRWPLPFDEVLHYECLYASGGGAVRATGGLPKTRQVKDPDLCTTVFKWYFAESAGQYWKDLEIIGADATAFLTNTTFKKGDATNMVIFDIDETLLSNLDEFEGRGFVAKAQSEDTNSSTSHHVHSEEDFSPALEAIKEVYMAAYDYGMSVALITGRSESSRQWTEDNLADQGFGVVCKQDGQGGVHRTEDPCYVALHLRDLDKDQHTLASVYKPQRRKQLQDAGYNLVATFGDQFSDLEGANSAIASWKIPNPLYLIL